MFFRRVYCFFVILACLMWVFTGCGAVSSPKHRHSYRDEIVLPGCETGGYTAHRCACGHEYRDAYTEPLGHDYAAVETKNPTCAEEGFVSFVCSRCGKTYTETVKPLGHTLKNADYRLVKASYGHMIRRVGTCVTCGKNIIETAAVFGAELAPLSGDETAKNTGGYVEATREGDTVTLTAFPWQYFRFKSWNDGADTLSRVVQIEDAPSLFAIFEHDAHTMPVMDINTFGDEVVSISEYTPCAVTLGNCDESLAFSGVEAGIRVRGNASSGYGDVTFIRQNKVHYRLKFDSKRALLDINDGAKCKSFVLLRGDSNFIKEPVSFFMGQKFAKDGYFVSDYTFVEVYFNHSYMGVYILCDQVQINPHRIDIEKQKPGETHLETGYLMEIDHYYAKEDYYFLEEYGGVYLTDMYGVTYKAPRVGYSLKNNEMTKAQLSFIQKYVDGAYQIVYQAIWKENFLKFDKNYNLVPAPEYTSSLDAVAGVMDIQSLVGMYLLHELCAERDVGVGSFFLYVDFTVENPRLTFCAPWDFSWAFGDDTGFRYYAFSTAAWQPAEFIKSAGNRSSTWFITLYHAGWFVDLVKQEWTKAYHAGIFDAMFDEITRISTDYKAEFTKNTARWESGDQSRSASYVYSWLENRIEWLHSQWLNEPS